MTSQTDSKQPTPDQAERNAFFPSPYSLSQFTSPKSDLSDADYPDAYQGGRWKVLLVAADERYLLTGNGTFFSTGNHPVETLLPMYHLDRAGFEFDIATLSGNPAKFEWWAFPSEDAEIKSLYSKYEQKFQQPLKLADVVSSLNTDANYIAVFIPGGHGALMGLPFSADMKATLQWAMQNDRFIITLCHGPAALLSASVDEPNGGDLFRGYRICAFPDSMDKQTPDIGYMPGPLRWFFGEKLAAMGVEIVNTKIDGSTFRDRKLLTGDSPFAGNNLGKLAARALLDEVQSTGGR
ncbi:MULTISPECIES: glyoxalase III HchA [Cupriavidus]|uniref:Hsp31 molecular chaperone n=2 Tax=Cupriavidus TaxID=106589 RepID=A0A375EQV3_9BURK|nr:MULTISPECIES: glyoxalase III HchA [Cupriavidus]MEC3768274.1 glyoxalase III HchA [Cupriavidus sp. SS-3]PZX26979.1 molecular chaperone Hsp31 and glyoxalase 3 [Cupriavidus alkaliphilus]SOY75058.1 Hsp31 molecular chaperone [Cupriavidus taiwanensis]SOY95089.1 Hsp31 molecular chaperone [Cupriavidus taiwanensis]SOY99040.1 Hsp31 molecular chaperone [Cupriavidus taiwanensis]